MLPIIPLVLITDIFTQVLSLTICSSLGNFTQNIETLLQTRLSVTTHRVISDRPAEREQQQPSAARTYSRLVSLGTLEGRDTVCVFPAVMKMRIPHLSGRLCFARRSLGVLCVHLSQFSDDFARDLTAARAPFGRLLDMHQVKRTVQARRARCRRVFLHSSFLMPSLSRYWP